VLPVPVSAHRQVLAAYDKIAAVDRPELWTALRSREDVLVEAKTVDERVRAGERLPLAGLLVVVNDNVELAGAGKPEAGAVAVRRLVRAGALALGKTGPGPRGEITGWRSAWSTWWSGRSRWAPVRWLRRSTGSSGSDRREGWCPRPEFPVVAGA
jgi:hypothetical protein